MSKKSFKDLEDRAENNQKMLHTTKMCIERGTMNTLWIIQSTESCAILRITDEKYTVAIWKLPIHGVNPGELP